MIDCGNAPELWRPYLESRLEEYSPLAMSITGHYDPDSLSGGFTVEMLPPRMPSFMVPAPEVVLRQKVD